MIASALTWLLTILSIASIGYYCTCMVAARKFQSRNAQRQAYPDPERPPATIMIPLCGVDFEAYENYVSFCRQDYPQYQIVFGVQEPNDSSIAVVERLMADFPGTDIKLATGSRVIGENPKVNNLHSMLSKAKHEMLVIADSDVRVASDFLSSVAPRLCDETVGLVTCFYKAGAAPNFASRIEAIGISAEFAPGVLAAWMKEGMTFALGATMAVSRKKLEAIGGFRTIADYLADDYMLGNLIWRAGGRIVLLPCVVETMLQPMSFAGMMRHQIRWGRGIRACRPTGHLGMIVTHGFVAALVNAALNFGESWSLLMLAAVTGVRFSMAWGIGVRLIGDRILRANWWLLPVRDILGFWVWCMSLWGRKVEWRNKRYRIIEDGKLTPLG